jgi:putative heme transporter
MLLRRGRRSRPGAPRAATRPAGAADAPLPALADAATPAEAGAAPPVVGVAAVPDAGNSGDEAVAWPVRAAAAWSWRFIVIAGAAYLALQVVIRLPLITYSVLVALLLAALLAPGVDRLRRWGMGPALSAALVFVGGILAVIGIFAALVTALVAGLPEITENARSGLQEIQDWLANGPLRIGDQQIQQFLQEGQNWIDENQSQLTSGAVGAAGAAGNFAAGVALMLFTAFFFLYDGRRIWAWMVRLFPRSAEGPVDLAGKRSWVTLVGYVRGLVLIAFIDAVGIGVVLLVVGVPLAIPLSILVFFGAFVPLVGAAITGVLAALVALVTNGPIAALIVLGGIVVVQQVEGNLLQPLIMSRAVSIHPLPVALAVTAGALLAGIGGAVVAVPIVAVVNTALVSLTRGREQDVPAAPPGLPTGQTTP